MYFNKNIRYILLIIAVFFCQFRAIATVESPNSLLYFRFKEIELKNDQGKLSFILSVSDDYKKKNMDKIEIKIILSQENNKINKKRLTWEYSEIERKVSDLQELAEHSWMMSSYRVDFPVIINKGISDAIILVILKDRENKYLNHYISHYKIVSLNHNMATVMTEGGYFASSDPLNLYAKEMVDHYNPELSAEMDALKDRINTLNQEEMEIIRKMKELNERYKEINKEKEIMVKDYSELSGKFYIEKYKRVKAIKYLSK